MYLNLHILFIFTYFLIIDNCNIDLLHVFIGSIVSLVILSVVTVIVAMSARYENMEYSNIETERLTRYMLSVLDSTRVNFVLTFSPSCALRITRGETEEISKTVDIWISTHILNAYLY